MAKNQSKITEVDKNQPSIFDIKIGDEKHSPYSGTRLSSDPAEILADWPDNRLKKLFLDYYDPEPVKLVLNTLHAEFTKSGVYSMPDDPEEQAKATANTISSIFLVDVPDLSKQNYKIAKALAVELNRINNGEYLIVTEDIKGHWCVMGDISALLYVYDSNIGGSFKTRPKLGVDKDLNNKFNDGIVFIHGFRTLVEKLFAVGIIYWANLKNGVWLFRLDRIRRPDELETLRAKDKKLTDTVRNLIMTNNIYPDLFGMINKMSRIIMPFVRKMEITLREAFGIALARDVMDLHNLYIIMVNKPINERQKYIANIKDKLLTIGAWLDVMLENHYLDKETLAKLANLLADMQVRVKGIEIEVERRIAKNGK